MKSAKDKLLESIVTENFSDEILSNALAVLHAKAIPMETPVGFISEKDARKYCGNVSRSTFWHWQKRGLKSYLVGGRRLFLPDDLKAFVLDGHDMATKTERIASK